MIRRIDGVLAALHDNELAQPFIVAAAGAVPFIEGEGAATIGILGGVNPVITALAAIIGNFLCVVAVVFLSSRARTAVVSRHRSRSAAGAGSLVTDNGRASGRSVKFQQAFDRYGVPGVSLLGPLLLPTQFMATMLAASGIKPTRILFWQGIAIVGWTTLVTLVFGGLMSAVG